MNGGESLVSTLIDNGVKYIFGVPGESYLSVLEAIRAKNNALRFINTRHESGASFAADAYGRLTSRPGVAFVTRGPGATNASIGIPTRSHATGSESLPSLGMTPAGRKS